MSYLMDLFTYYYDQYCHLDSDKITKLPGNTYVCEDNSILCIPREDGDNRYQYGENGFNLWAYASGNMHANQGLFSLFLRSGEGREANTGFIVGVKQSGSMRLIPLTASLMMDTSGLGLKRFSVFTQTQALYFTECKGLLSLLQIYADKDNDVYFNVTVMNRSGKELEIALDSYINPYLKEGLAVSDEDKWFRKCEVIPGDGELPGYLFAINIDLTRTLSIVNFGAIAQALELQGGAEFLGVRTTTSRAEFMGGRLHSLNDPTPLKKGKFPEGRSLTTFTDTAVAGQMASVKLPAGATVSLLQSFSTRRNCTAPLTYEQVARRTDLKELEQMILEADRSVELKKDRLNFEISDNGEKGREAAKLNGFMYQLIKQVDFCASISGYVQLSPNSLVGIRDVFQAIEGNLYSAPEQSRAKILEALEFTDPSGRPPRQYALPAQEGGMPPVDLRSFIDQGVWIIDTLITYIKYTKDYSILEEVCGYTKIVDESQKLVERSDIRDTVLDHACRIVDYLLANQDEETGCIHALYGDWNDALDGLGVRVDGGAGYGTGVSVMVSLQVVKNLREMIELLGRLNKSPYTREAYISAVKRLEEGLKEYAIVTNSRGDERIVHGWGDQRLYYVGSFNDRDGQSRHGITSNAFWVLSGMHADDTSHKNTIIKAFEALDSKYGCKTFVPGFERDAKGFGRIGKLPMGTAENGAAYIHATTFAIMALFRMGEAERAWKQLKKIIPVYHKRLSTSPYVMPNSYGENPALNIDGESMNDWQTGSSNVVLKTFINDVFGFRPEYDRLVIAPAKATPYSELVMSIRYLGHRITVKLVKASIPYVRVNGAPARASYTDVIMDRDVLVFKDSDICEDMLIEIGR